MLHFLKKNEQKIVLITTLKSKYKLILRSVKQSLK
jgi:hypothetical protein